MFIVTNRQVDANAEGTAKLGPRPNEKGSNELRVVEVVRAGRGWSISVLPDELDGAWREAVVKKLNGGAGITSDTALYGSHYAAAKTLQQARRRGRNVLFFVHGYNNDIDAVLARADQLEKKYNVVVICFSWPARGGGVRGVLSYRQDKRDAKASTAAFERFLVLVRQHIDRLNGSAKEECMRRAAERYPENLEQRDECFEALMQRACPVRLSLMLHSMGNYLLKQTLKSSTSDEIGSLFDNVVLVAADTNNEGHPGWVDRIRARESIYIIINENDRALRASEVKVGEAQRGRLGRLRRRLESRLALYVDATDAPSVGNSHAYFEDAAVRTRNSILRRFFQSVFNGEHGEDLLSYDQALGAYRVAAASRPGSTSPPRRGPRSRR